MPGEHLLAEHLVEWLIEEVVQGDTGIGADRSVRMTEDILGLRGIEWAILRLDA
jgi:hypothetical protein